jgi:hypothetical protein
MLQNFLHYVLPIPTQYKRVVGKKDMLRFAIVSLALSWIRMILKVINAETDVSLLHMLTTDVEVSLGNFCPIWHGTGHALMAQSTNVSIPAIPKSKYHKSYHTLEYVV